MHVTVIREFHFEAAHHLTWHPGKCARVHGHSYRLEVAVRGVLDARGVVLDFAEIDEVVKREVMVDMDHHDLNEVLDNPTCERTALEIGARLVKARLPLTWLRLWETDRGSALVSVEDLG